MSDPSTPTNRITSATGAKSTISNSCPGSGTHSTLRMCHQAIVHQWGPKQIEGDVAPSPRFGHTAVVFGNKMLMFGGRDQKCHRSDLWALDLDNNQWQMVYPKASSATASSTEEGSTEEGSAGPAPRAGHTAIMAGHRMIVFAGGVDRDHLCNDLWEFDVKANRWTNCTNNGALVLPPASKGHTAVNYLNRFMLVHGAGTDDKGDGCLWELDLTKMTWRRIGCYGTIPQKREYHVAEMADGNTMLVFGGRDGAHFYNDLHEVNVQERVWRKIVPLGECPSSRMCASSVFHNGTLCVFLGGSTVLHTDNYEFDVKKHTWRKLPDGSGPLVACTRPTTVLHNNSVTMFGGCTNSSFLNATLQMSLGTPSLKDCCRLWLKEESLPPATGDDAPGENDLEDDVELPFHITAFLAEIDS